VNLYGSDQVCDRLNGEIVDHYSPFGLLVLCGGQARLVSLYMHHRHVFHEAALIVINFKLLQHFSCLASKPCPFVS